MAPLYMKNGGQVHLLYFLQIVAKYIESGAKGPFWVSKMPLGTRCGTTAYRLKSRETR